MNSAENKTIDPGFKDEVAGMPGGENIKLCYSCGTCTAGCPVSDIDPEFNPRSIIRRVILGFREEVLSSPEIWRCVQCYSCTVKCPQNVKFKNIIQALRMLAVREGYADASLASEIEGLGRFIQKARRQMVDMLVNDRKAFDVARKRIGEATGIDDDSR